VNSQDRVATQVRLRTGIRSPHSGAASGQAMIELTVGLVALLALFAGLLQLAKLSIAQTDTLFSARREAGTRAMSTVAVSSAAEYIRYWEEGDDKKRYSVDDTHTEADGAAFSATVPARAARDNAAWNVMQRVPDNPVLTLRDSPAPATQFGLLEGKDSVTVPLLPVVQHLLYNADSIEIESKVWMPWAREIY
jgi:hypothetical protein